MSPLILKKKTKKIITGLKMFVLDFYFILKKAHLCGSIEV